MSRHTNFKFLSQLDDGDARVRTGTAASMTGLLLLQLSKMLQTTTSYQTEINQSLRICLNDALTLLCDFSKLVVQLLHQPEVNTFFDDNSCCVDVLQKDNGLIGLKLMELLNGFRSELYRGTLKENDFFNSCKSMELLPINQTPAPIRQQGFDSEETIRGISTPKPMDLLQLPMYLESPFGNSTSGGSFGLPFGQHHSDTVPQTFVSGLDLATVQSVVLQLINSQLQPFVSNPNGDTVPFLSERQIPQVDNTGSSTGSDVVILAQSDDLDFSEKKFKTEASGDACTQCGLDEFLVNAGVQAKCEVCSKKVQNEIVVNVGCQTDEGQPVGTCSKYDIVAMEFKDQAVGTTCEYFMEASRPSQKELFNQRLKLCNAFCFCVGDGTHEGE